ncbi:hypothetical protein VSR34_36260 [Paraburkholderia sp. JHI2823]|uniref:hypothetical protein n=1 Tax=Paraburkholderia sp. JHI2823 TaxID=3112960 RepID=UPI00316C3DFF
MKSSTDLAEFDAQRKAFAGHTTRVWNKTESALKGDPRFYNAKHVKRYKAARKDDALISYLAHLRDVDEHSHVDTTTTLPPGFVNISADGRVWARNPKITINGVTMDLPPPPGFKQKIVGAELRACPVTSRGKTYDVPTAHLGQDITAVTLVELAEFALAFYTGFIDGLASEGWDSE